MVLVHFLKTINIIHYAGGLRILADGDRMAVKEERALADGTLTPFCVFLFGKGRELQDSVIILQTSKVFILIYFSKVTTEYLSSNTAEEKSSKK